MAKEDNVQPRSIFALGEKLAGENSKNFTGVV